MLLRIRDFATVKLLEQLGACGVLVHDYGRTGIQATIWALCAVTGVT